VSALIHAATMVTAGVYLVARMSGVYEHAPEASAVIAVVGVATAFLAATIALVQTDIKKVLAYSTISQLGFMFLALGVEQDVRRMGGLAKRIPLTFWTFAIATAAIAGLPPLAGFFSKDEILYQTFTSDNPIGKLLWFVGLVTAGMTSFYMFRLWFKTFFGPEHFDEPVDLHDHGAAVYAHSGSHAVMVADPEEDHPTHAHGVHESPWIMLFPLVILAILSVVGGWVGVPAAMAGHDEIGHFLDPVFTNPSAEAATVTAGRGLELGLAFVSVLVAAIGLYIAYIFYYIKPRTAAALASRFPALYRLVENKFYIDEIYSTLIVAPLLMFTRLFLGGLIDGGLVKGSGAAAGASTRGLSSLVRRVQSGNIRSYAGWLAIGAAAVLLVMIFGRSIWLH
jgi:NADH-quinone oxidoreductase subunit L